MTTMTIVRDAFRRTNASLHLVPLLYTVNLLSALPLALAFRDFMTRALGSSLSAGSLMGGFDFTLVRDVLAADGAGWHALTRMLIWSVPVYAATSVLLTGGVLSSLLRRDERFSLPHFFRECGSYFLRFARILLILCAGLLLFTLAAGLLLFGLFSLLSTGSSSEVTVTTLFALCAAIFLLPVFFLLLAADYARIFTVTSTERRMWGACREGLRFVGREFFRVLGLQLLLLLVPALCVAAYLLLEGAIPMTSDLTIILVLLLQQAYMVSRMWTRVLLFAGQSALYQDRAVP